MTTPQRISWAIDLLKPWSGMELLEVGCGRGHAAQTLCGKLGPDGYVGVDRSKTAVDAARKLNADAAGKGVAEFRLGELSDQTFGRRRFDRVLAINVNVFWTGGEDELAVLHGALKANGRMLLVYEAPSPARLETVEEKLRAALRGARFAKLTVARAADNARLMAMWASRRF